MTTDLVTVSRPMPGARLVRLERAERLNTLTEDLVTQLTRTLAAVAEDRECRVVVLTGAGRAFCAGLDLTGYDEGREEREGPALGTLSRQREIAALTEQINRLPQPVIAAVNGPATGGGLALTLASDIRIAARSAVFAVSFIRAGFSACDLGTSWLLPRIVGVGHAHELMLTGRTFDATEALEIGLVTDLVDDRDLLDRAYSIAAKVMGNAPASVALTKQGMWAALEIPSLKVAIEFENRQQVITALTEDAREAATSFLQKREPVFKNR